MDAVIEPLDESLMTARDERIATMLKARISELDEEARRLEAEARPARAEADKIRKAVRAERWWEIGALSVEDVESLCNVSPVDLLGEG